VLEGGKAHDDMEAGLSAFLSYGTALWLRSHSGESEPKQSKWRKPQWRRSGELPVLIANIIGGG